MLFTVVLFFARLQTLGVCWRTLYAGTLLVTGLRERRGRERRRGWREREMEREMG